MSEEKRFPAEDTVSPINGEMAQVMATISGLGVTEASKEVVQAITQKGPVEFVTAMLMMQSQATVAVTGMSKRYVGENAYTQALVELLKQVYNMDYFQIEEYLEVDKKLRDLLWDASDQMVNEERDK